jgi:hypothetical protein
MRQQAHGVDSWAARTKQADASCVHVVSSSYLRR